MNEGYVHGYSDAEQERLIRMNEALNPRCLRMISLEGDERILDLGCGLGILSRELANRVPKGSVTGLEFNPKQLARARQLAAQDGVADQVRYVQGSVYDLDQLFDQPFDLIFTRFLLEHLEDVPKALSHCYSALQTGGRLIIMDDDHANFRIWPHSNLFQEAWSALCSGFMRRGHDPYIGRKMVSLVYDAGFRESKIDWVRFGGCADQPDFPIYADNLIALFQGIERDLVDKEEWSISKIRNLHTELACWKEKPDASLWYAANWVETVKI
ncbi:MAG: class I SAM-dependent methyltransferase [Saprospiraceae bacterium]|nr:class I SAM-dependent methyltransferase [Saprospiraceae bacterium]